jgi:hypothetical protein
MIGASQLRGFFTRAVPRLVQQLQAASPPTPYPTPHPAAAAPVQGGARVRRNAARMHLARLRAAGRQRQRHPLQEAALKKTFEQDAAMRQQATRARMDACARGWTRCGAGLAAAPHGWRFRVVACCPLLVARCTLQLNSDDITFFPPQAESH